MTLKSQSADLMTFANVTCFKGFFLQCFKCHELFSLLHHIQTVTNLTNFQFNLLKMSVREILYIFGFSYLL